MQVDGAVITFFEYVWYTSGIRMLSERTQMILAGAMMAIVAVAAFVMWRVSRKPRNERFFDKIKNTFVGAKDAAIGKVGEVKDAATGKVGEVKDAATGEVNDAIRDATVAKNVIGGGLISSMSPAPSTSPPPYVPSFSGRRFDKYDWSCPWWTVETGNADNSKACFKRPYTSPAWRDTGDGKWGWSCPNGTTPNNDPQWEKQCAVGYTGRVYTDEGWKCPQGTTDTGKTWDNSDWYEAQRQCERRGPYTTRVAVNKKWVCPPGTKDTGLSWGSGTKKDRLRGLKQCKWIGP